MPYDYHPPSPDQYHLSHNNNHHHYRCRQQVQVLPPLVKYTHSLSSQILHLRIHSEIKVKRYTFRGSNYFFYIFASLLKRESTRIEKNLLHQICYFPFCSHSQRGNFYRKNNLPLKILFLKKKKKKVPSRREANKLTKEVSLRKIDGKHEDSLYTL